MVKIISISAVRNEEGVVEFYGLGADGKPYVWIIDHWIRTT